MGTSDSLPVNGSRAANSVKGNFNFFLRQILDVGSKGSTLHLGGAFWFSKVRIPCQTRYRPISLKNTMNVFDIKVFKSPEIQGK